MEIKKNKEVSCPLCKGETREVLGATVKNFVIDNLVEKVKNDNYHICLNENCKVAYFDDQMIFETKDIKTPIWYKKDSDPKYICYCNKVTEQDIFDAVIEKGANDFKEVCEITGAMKNSNCKINNPFGSCCSPNIKATIEKAIKQK